MIFVSLKEKRCKAFMRIPPRYLLMNAGCLAARKPPFRRLALCVLEAEEC
jgi:hypothetical protein